MRRRLFLSLAALALYAQDARIRRDSFGVPHIWAKTEEAVAYGFGYAQAEDHGLQIAESFVRARGLAAKTFGDGAEADFALAQFDNAAASRRGFATLDPLMQRIYRGYIAGVNRYIAVHRQEFPSWVPVFDEYDVVANIRDSAVLASRAVAQRLRAKYDGRTPRASHWREPLPGLDEEAGSNAFAIGPSRSRSRKAMLLGNPHLGWQSRYWEAQLTVPGKLNFYGSTLPGLPVLRAGFNEHLGFVQTNNAPDMADVYALKLDSADAGRYVFEGQSRPLARRTVTLEIRQQGGAPRQETRTFEESHLGPVIFRNATHVFAYRSTQLESFRHMEGFYKLSKTKSLAEWNRVMQQNLCDYSNFTYADAKGNIQYLWNARMPVRVDDGTDYSLDVPAEDGKYVWTRLHPVADFPRLLNPAGGYVQNCNNPPWFPSRRDPLDPQRFPRYFEQGELGLRPQLAIEMLESRESFTLEDVMRMKFDTKLLLADRVKGELLKAVAGVEELAAAKKVLEEWDNRASATSRGTLLFLNFWDRYAAAARPVGEAAVTDRGAAVKALTAAADAMGKTFGRLDPVFGEVNRYRFPGIDLPADGAPGAYGAFRVMRYDPQPDGKRAAGLVEKGKPLAGFGDAWVLAVEFSRPVRAYSILAYGQSANPESRHSRDQIEMYARHEYKKIRFSEAEIKADLEREYRP